MSRRLAYASAKWDPVARMERSEIRVSLSIVPRLRTAARRKNTKAPAVKPGPWSSRFILGAAMVAVATSEGLLRGDGHGSRGASDQCEDDGDKCESSFHGACPLKKVTQ